MGLTNVTKMLALSGPPSARSAQRPTAPPPPDVVVLKHCRCMDCRHFSRVGTDYFCSEYIGGTSVAWATGKRSCDPPPDAWHYCSCYHGPQTSKDVWLWPRTAAQVGAGSNISRKAEQPSDRAPTRRHGAASQPGQGGQHATPGSFPASSAEDRDGNGRALPFCLSKRRAGNQQAPTCSGT